jgi:hypothetical protein
VSKKLKVQSLSALGWLAVAVEDGCIAYLLYDLHVVKLRLAKCTIKGSVLLPRRTTQTAHMLGQGLRGAVGSGKGRFLPFGITPSSHFYAERLIVQPQRVQRGGVATSPRAYRLKRQRLAEGPRKRAECGGGLLGLPPEGSWR